MKKLLAGCLVVVVLGAVALGVAAYFGYRAARPMIDGASTWVQQAREMAALSDRVENKAPFEPPAGGELTEAQMRRFLAVHERVRTTLGSRWEELQARGRAVEDRARDGGRTLSFTEIGAMMSELGSVLGDARRAHVEAMNAEGFSLSEFSWVRLRVYEAAGFEVARAIDWSSAEAMIQKGADEVGMSPPSVALPEVPERNRELVKPHLETLREWLPLTVLGL